MPGGATARMGTGGFKIRLPVMPVWSLLGSQEFMGRLFVDPGVPDPDLEGAGLEIIPSENLNEEIQAGQRLSIVLNLKDEEEEPPEESSSDSRTDPTPTTSQPSTVTTPTQSMTQSQTDTFMSEPTTPTDPMTSGHGTTHTTTPTDPTGTPIPATSSATQSSSSSTTVTSQSTFQAMTLPMAPPPGDMAEDRLLPL